MKDRETHDCAYGSVQEQTLYIVAGSMSRNCSSPVGGVFTGWCRRPAFDASDIRAKSSARSDRESAVSSQFDFLKRYLKYRYKGTTITAMYHPYKKLPIAPARNPGSVSHSNPGSSGSQASCIWNRSGASRPKAMQIK
jgi:hypothetical protein|tara:strand:- start:69982 stop:70395 length:414 start_codon:yes stop_codon:yes gene_type:complete